MSNNKSVISSVCNHVSLDVDVESGNKNIKPNAVRWRDQLVNDNDKCITCMSLLVLFILLVVMVPCVTLSYHYNTYAEYGIRNNVYHGAETGKVYDEGRFFLTIDNTMIKFPSTYNRITISSAIFAENGLEFDCDSTFFYRLPKEYVGQIYDTYGTNYGSRVENTAAQIIKNVASSFSVNEFLLNRTDIKQAIAIALEEGIWTDFNIEVPQDLYEIVKITFPQSIIDVSLNTAIVLQENELFVLQQAIDIIYADTNTMVATIDVQTEQTIQFSETTATRLIEESKSTANQIALTTRGSGINIVCNELSLSNNNHKVQIVEAFAIMDNGNFTLLNGVDNAIIRI
mgnify:CR=1 FL=1